MNLVPERNAAIKAALKAGALVRYRAGTLDETDVREKGKHDLVTVVDEESEKIIIGALSETFPEDLFLGEEGVSQVQHSDSGSGNRKWIIDPIDGTTNFAHKHPPYCISIGLEIDGLIQVGVIYEIGADELYTAIRGQGAYMNGRPMRVSTVSDLYGSIITTGFPFKEFTRIDAYIEVLRGFMQKARAVRRPGSAAADLAMVAAGRMDGFFEIGLSAWDVAAGSLLVEEAGGKVTDLSGCNSHIYGNQILAGNGIINEQMLEVLKPLTGEPQGS